MTAPLVRRGVRALSRTSGPAAIVRAAAAFFMIAAPAAMAAEASFTDTVEPPALESGSSGREARRQAIAAIPLDAMSAADRRTVEKSLRSTTLYRRLPIATISCQAALLDFILAKPETLVDVWRVLGISRLSLDPAGPGQWQLADGYGTFGTVRLVHAARHDGGGLLVFHGRGGYSGSLSPRNLTGSCVVVVRHATAPDDAAGRPQQTLQIDAFLDVDGLGLEIVTRALQPLIIHSAAANLHEISLFVSQFAAAAARNPRAIARLTERMPRTGPEDRRRLAELAGGVSSAHGDALAADVDEVQATLASRWMTTEQLDQMQR